MSLAPLAHPAPAGPRRPPLRWAFLALTLWTALAALPTRASVQDLEPCDGMEGALCGTLTVFEDRAAASGRTLDLNVVVLPATGEEARPDPLFILTGGPGQGATTVAEPLLRGGLPLRQERDVVLVDQRGTGGSNPLACAPPADPWGFFGSIFGPEEVRACRRALEAKADLTLYTTPVAADDLDQVREWLGYDRINLWGMSYGTRAAMVYLRRHPEHARSAILEGVAALNHFTPVHYAYDAQLALDRLLGECEADPACAEAFPRVRHELRVLVDRLRRGPAATRFETPGGEEVEVGYSLGDFGYTVRGMLYGNGQAMALPAWIHHAAAEEDFSAFARAYYQRAAGLAQFVADGLYLSIMCSEDVPYFSDEEVRRFTEGTFLGDYLVRDYRRACSLWPRGEIPEGYHEPVATDAPVLILSGDRDPVTPPSWGEEGAREMSSALHLVFARQGHGVSFNPCVQGIYREFLEAGSVEGLETSCIEELEAPVFEIEADAP